MDYNKRRKVIDDLLKKNQKQTKIKYILGRIKNFLFDPMMCMLYLVAVFIFLIMYVWRFI